MSFQLSILVIVLFLLHISQSFYSKLPRINNRLISSNKVLYVVQEPEPELIFDPEILDINELNNLSYDDVLYQIFLKQINAEAIGKEINDNSNNFNNDREDIDNYNLGDAKFLKSSSSQSNREDYPTILQKGIPLEFIYNKKIAFGNFIKQKEDSKALVIRMASGTEVTIDAGQIITLWDTISDDTWPTTSEEWARIGSEALRILGNMSPRKSDLQDFFTKVTSLRGATLPVDSLDLAVYIFQEKCFRSWIDPYADADRAKARVPYAAQRYAAALLLFHDDVHFKRTQSQLIKPDSNSNIQGELEVIEGGFKVLSEGQAMFREGEVFAEYICSIQEEKEESLTFRANCITRLLRGLELYAMSSTKTKPPPAIKHVLKKFEIDPSPLGARELLTSINRRRGAIISSPSSSSSSSSSSLGQNKVHSVGVATNTVGSVVPWTSDQLAAAAELLEQREKRGRELAAERVGKAGKKGPSGRMDYRENIEHPVMCIDNKRTAFYDDAFAISPSTGELLVHVVDVIGALRGYKILEETAKERISSIFLPTGPLHMLPPQALEALRLSDEYPNEVLTVAIKVNAETGDLQSFRVFPSTIGPVFPLTIEDSDSIISSSDDTRIGIPQEVMKDLKMCSEVVDQVLSTNQWVGAHLHRTDNRREFAYDKRSGAYEMNQVDTKGSSNRLVNALLTLYSNASCTFCQTGPQQQVPVPIAWENRDRVDNKIIRRFASQPLRNWISMMQQRQLRAAMKMELPLSRKDCAMAVSHHNANRKQSASFMGIGRSQIAFESLESHCATMMANGHSEVILQAEGLGRGGLVRIVDFRIDGSIKKNVERGEKVNVRIRKILPEARRVEIELVE